MKVVLYAHDWAPLIGGIQTLYAALANGLQRWSNGDPGKGFEVTLITQTPGHGTDDSRFPFAVVRRPSPRKLIGLIRSADLLHVAGPAMLPMAIGWILGKPTLVEHDGYQSICPNGLLVYEPDGTVCPGHFMARRYTRCVACHSCNQGFGKSVRSLALTFVRRWLGHRVSLNIAPSRHIAMRVALPRTRLIYHGVPKSAAIGETAPYESQGQRICFAYLGRLVTEKGLPILLRAARQLSQAGYRFSLKVVGDGAERPALEKMTEDFGLGPLTEFVGAVPQEATRGALKNVTAVVIPSVWEDVAPLVPIDQMMEGRLVIASDIGGLGELVDGVGFKFPPGNDAALAACMRQVIESPEMVKGIVNKARQHALERFSEERMVLEHVQVYREVLEGQAQSQPANRPSP